MCLNCGYPYASEEGYCSESCQREFEEEAELANENREDDAILAELL